MKKIAVVIAVLLFASVQLANAGLILDLRTTSGGNSVELLAGSTGHLSLELWGVVAGTNTFNTDDGIQSIYTWLTTTNSGLTGLTGFSATGTRAFGFTGAPNTEGTLVLSGGIYDLKGTTNTNSWGTKTKAGTNVPPWTGLLESGMPEEDMIAHSNGGEFKVATFIYNYSNVQGTETQYALVNHANPTWGSVVRKPATWAEDSPTVTNKSANNSTTVGLGDGVKSMVVPIPEASLLILLGMGCLALLAFRRRK